MRRLLCAFALGVLVAISVAGQANAHKGNPDFRSEITGIDPEVPGLRAEILNYDADVLLSYTGDQTVVVMGYEGEPYLRFSPDGAVEANTRSPSLYLNTDRYGNAPVPPGADPGAEPEWKKVAGTGEFLWHDHRSHYMSLTTPAQVTDPDQRTKIFDYEIPLEVDGSPVVVSGTLYWAGTGDFLLLPFIVLGLLATTFVVVVIVVRGRRPQAGGPDPVEGGTEGGGREAW